MSFEEDDYDNDDVGGELQAIVPTDDRWKSAAYLQLKPYDTEKKMQIDGPHRPLLIPLLGTSLHYSVEMVYQDGSWDFVYFGTDLDEAKRLVQRWAAEHDLQINRHHPDCSDIAGY